jgi:hypothetical protein
MEPTNDCQLITLTCFEMPEIGEQDAKETNQEQECKETTTTTNNISHEQGETADDHQEDPPKEHQQQGEGAGAGAVSCGSSMHLLDAQTTSWASQGGIVPQEHHNHQILTHDIPYAQPRGGIAKEQEQRSNISKEDPSEEQLAKEQDAGANEIWVKGAKEEDDARYRKFLTYMEEKRQEARMLLQKEDDKKEAKEKEAIWALLRESMAFLRENSHMWQERKVEECEKVKQEAKEDRLAVSRMKKKRYGIKRLSKEENKRIKERAEDRILLAKARGNLWKLARNPEERQMEDKEEEAWRVMGEGAIEFTEKEDWEMTTRWTLRDSSQED